MKVISTAAEIQLLFLGERLHLDLEAQHLGSTRARRGLGSGLVRVARGGLRVFKKARALLFYRARKAFRRLGEGRGLVAGDCHCVFFR